MQLNILELRKLISLLWFPLRSHKTTLIPTLDFQIRGLETKTYLLNILREVFIK